MFVSDCSVVNRESLNLVLHLHGEIPGQLRGIKSKTIERNRTCDGTYLYFNLLPESEPELSRIFLHLPEKTLFLYLTGRNSAADATTRILHTSQDLQRLRPEVASTTGHSDLRCAGCLQIECERIQTLSSCFFQGKDRTTLLTSRHI